jgi:hypothetical protein
MTQKEIEDRIAWIADTSSSNAFESSRMKVFGNRIAKEMIAAERERIKKELLDIINLYNDNEMFGYSVAKNAINNL